MIRHEADFIADMPKDAVWLSSAGLWIGDRLICRHDQRDDKSVEWLWTTLASAFGMHLSSRARNVVEIARGHARGGDLARANLSLALNKLARVPTHAHGRDRLKLADQPSEWSESNFSASSNASKPLERVFNQTELRVPPHSGEASGEWVRADHMVVTDDDVVVGVPRQQVVASDIPPSRRCNIVVSTAYNRSWPADIMRQLLQDDGLLEGTLRCCLMPPQPRFSPP